MKKKDYTQRVSDMDKIRVRFTQEKGKIIEFVVNYYALVEGRWRQVLRIDNCHNSSPHQHTYHLHSKQYRVVLNSSANTAFTEAKRYIMKDMEKIRENFLRT
jgi:hypothetical protein